MARRRTSLALLLLLGQPVAQAADLRSLSSSEPLSRPATGQLERSWQQLDRELQLLDQLLPKTPEPPVRDDLAVPLLPEPLRRANAPAQGVLQGAQALPAAPLSLPDAAELQRGRIQGLSLEQAVALAFRQSAALQGQREQVAAALAGVQAALGTYWPRLSAIASATVNQNRTTTTALTSNDNPAWGPQFSPNGLLTPGGQATSGAFYVPAGGAVGVTAVTPAGSAGLQVSYALLDLARTPTVRAARAQLEQERQTYANQLRRLQLQVSEAYYQLQQSEQLVRLYDANLRNDLLILEDTLALKQAGLVPRLDLLRRRAIEAGDQENLIQAMADRAVARRQLAVLLNLPADLTPSASDPITVQPRWPLNLEQSLLAAYRGNPELEAILATRQALAQQQQATAAALLPTLSLVAGGGGLTSQTSLSNFNLTGGGCCGASALPLSTSGGWSWSAALTLTWLLFDAGTTAAQVRSLARREAAAAQQYAASRNDIRLRLEQAFYNHEASLAKLSSARRGVAAALEAFRDARLRYRTGLSSELDLSNTQERLVNSLVRRLNATVMVNITYARLLRDLLPIPQDPAAPVPAQLQLPLALAPLPAGPGARPGGSGLRP